MQGRPVPQRHVPDALHRSAVSGGHAMHDSPPVPHVVGPRTSHVVPLQHPSGHDVASHSHCPAEHRCPAAHAGPLPHAGAALA